MEQYLLSIIVPNNSHTSRRTKFFVLENSQTTVYSSIDDFKAIDKTIITFDFDALINYQGSILGTIPDDFIDLEQLCKQLDGKPIKSFRKDELPSWSIWNKIKSCYKEEELEDLEILKKIFFAVDYTNYDRLTELASTFLVHIKKVYLESLQSLKDKGEYERFQEVERKIGKITAYRSRHGITIDNSNLRTLVQNISEQLYSYRNILQLEYSIFTANDQKKIHQILAQKTTIADLEEKINERGFYSFLKTYRKNSSLIETLYQEKKAWRNLSVLLAIGALSSAIVFPSFDAFGTVTARTKMISPNFQILSKKYRSIVTAAEGYRLVYPDFGQFEASILASLSNDEKLVAYCNSTDLYSEIATKIGLAEFLPTSKEQRDFAKVLFFKYSYGMNIESHEKLLIDFGLTESAKILSPRIVDVFTEFKKLELYRQEIGEQARTKGFVSSTLGNHRYKDDNDHVASWALSQRIQGTASLILKRAIIAVLQKDPEIQFLIPMHDAALFEVKSSEEENSKATIRECFEEALIEVCPDIVPKVVFKNFAE
jgi:DNA polymerase I-like protein with 3'-5' exonuclease and polymerase domains